MTTIHDISRTHTVVHSYMEELRNVEKQSNRFAFRENVRRIGRCLGYEISKSLDYSSATIQTPLAMMEHPVLQASPVIVTILRAGLALHEGLMDVFPHAESGFISAYRKHDEQGFHIEVEYVACPDLTGRVVIINDPMLATGQSFVNVWNAILRYGIPKQVVLAAVIASKPGLEYITKHAPAACDLWVAAVDPELNEHKYIVPGLGDAGDLAFGPKVQS